MNYKFIHVFFITCCPLFSHAQEVQDLSIQQTDQNNFQIKWFGKEYRTYFKQETEILSGWDFTSDFIEQGTGSLMNMSITLDSAPEKYFTRLKYTDIPTADPQMADFDGDGVASIYELELLGTDPLVANTDGIGANDGGGDTDGDDIPDALEMYFFGNLVDQTGSDDADLDGLTNAEELALATDPNTNEADTAANRNDYTYDLLGRLIDADGALVSSYTYDEEGNVITAQ